MAREFVTIRASIDQRSLTETMVALSMLSRNAQKKVVRPAATYAFRPALQSAKRRVRVQHGTLKKSLILKVYTKRDKVFAVVKPDEKVSDPTTGERPFAIAHLVEFGAGIHEIMPEKAKALKIVGSFGVGGQSVSVERFVGRVVHPGARPKPFLRPALQEQEANVVRRYREKVRSGIDALVRSGLSRGKLKKGKGG